MTNPGEIAPAHPLPDGAHDDLWFRLKRLREGDIVTPYAMSKLGYMACMDELCANEPYYIEIMASDRASRMHSRQPLA